MATAFTYNVNFEITCNECGCDLMVLSSGYREPELCIKPCVACLHEAKTETREELEAEIDEAFEAGERRAEEVYKLAKEKEQ